MSNKQTPKKKETEGRKKPSSPQAPRLAILLSETVFRAAIKLSEVMDALLYRLHTINFCLSLI